MELEPEPESSLWVWRMSCSNVIYKSGIAGRVCRTLPAAYSCSTPKSPATPRPRLPRERVETSRVTVRSLAVYKQFRPFRWPVAFVFCPSSKCGSAGDKECVSRKGTWWRHSYVPDMSAVPMPSEGGRIWLHSSLYGNVEMPACLACRPRSGVFVRSPKNRRTSVVGRVRVEEDQNNAASSHLPLDSAR